MTAEKYPVDYRPRFKPEIIEMADKMQTIHEEKQLLAVNDTCSIVERPMMRILGIRVQHTPQSEYDAVQIPQQLIHDGTCALLEQMAGNTHAGRYVAAMTDVVSGNEFTYVIGVEVKDFAHLPEFLPRNATTLICPEGCYARQGRMPDVNAKHTMSKLSDMNLHKECGYAYDPRTVPYFFFDAQGELLTVYEPVRQPKDDKERYASVGWEIVTIPEIKALGCTGEGMECMFKLFDLEAAGLDWHAADVINMHQFLSWGFQEDGKAISFMGRRVANFDHIPQGMTPRTRPSQTYVRFWQQQIDNDNAWLIWSGAKDVCFFNDHPEWETDYHPEWGYDLIEHQYEQGTSVYIPIKRKA